MSSARKWLLIDAPLFDERTCGIQLRLRVRIQNIRKSEWIDGRPHKQSGSRQIMHGLCGVTGAFSIFRHNHVQLPAVRVHPQ